MRESSSEIPESGRALIRRSEEHTSELQSLIDLVCRLLLEKKDSRVSLRPITCFVGRVRRPPPRARPREAAAAPSYGVEGRDVSRFGVPNDCLFFLKKRGPPESSTFPHPNAFPF